MRNSKYFERGDEKRRKKNNQNLFQKRNSQPKEKRSGSERKGKNAINCVICILFGCWLM